MWVYIYIYVCTCIQFVLKSCRWTTIQNPWQHCPTVQYNDRVQTGLSCRVPRANVSYNLLLHMSTFWQVCGGNCSQLVLVLYINNECMWDMSITVCNNVASGHADFHPGISLNSLPIGAEYRVFLMKRYLHLSSFSLCSKCVSATLIVCIIYWAT